QTGDSLPETHGSFSDPEWRRFSGMPLLSRLEDGRRRLWIWVADDFRAGLPEVVEMSEPVSGDPSVRETEVGVMRMFAAEPVSGRVEAQPWTLLTELDRPLFETVMGRPPNDCPGTRITGSTCPDYRLFQDRLMDILFEDPDLEALRSALALLPERI
ncbi:MAG: hypothetical protein WBF53_16505, partial [Litorimonas sp.]